MWHLKKIPKIAHFYWGGRPLTYLQYMSVYTFWRLNPEWEIHFHQPEKPSLSTSWLTDEQKYTFNGHDYLYDLFEIPVKAKYYDFPTKFNMPNEMSEVHKSDLLRWHLLNTVGGLWSDMDVIYFKPMDYLEINKPENADMTAGVSLCKYGHSIGFLLSSMGCYYYRTLFYKAKGRYNEKEYQTMGVKTLNSEYPTLENMRYQCPLEKFINIPMDAVYAYDAMNVKDLYHVRKPQKLTQNSIGIHWYAGHTLSGIFLNTTFGGESDLPDCVLSDVIRNAPNTMLGHIKTNTQAGDSFLDLGCGDKKISSRFLHATTVDVWEKCNPDIVHDMNDLPLPFATESYDHILLLDVIEHFDKEKGLQILEEAKRICRKSIYLLTPLWWQENDQNIHDPTNVYFNNKYNLHKSLWAKKDFDGWKIVSDSGPYKNYFFGKWLKQ